MAISLCLFSPFGVGYALSYEEAMDLETETAERMLEAKNKVIERFSSRR